MYVFFYICHIQINCYLDICIIVLSREKSNIFWQVNQKEKKESNCIAPVVWSFLSTTAQLYATHRRGGRRRKRHFSSTQEWGHSGMAWGNCVSQAAQAEWCYQDIPPPPHSTFSWTEISDFQEKRLKGMKPLFRDPEVMQLNLDGFCDSIQTWMEVIGHLWAELGFCLFLRKRVRMSAAAYISRDADILACFGQVVPVQPAVPVRQTRCPYKLSGFVNRFHLGTRWWRVNTFRERSSAGLRRRTEWRVCRAQIVRDWTPTFSATYISGRLPQL